MVIANMLTTIRNALMINQKSVRIPRSKFKLALAKILKKQGVISKIKKKDRELIFNLNNKFLEFKRISRPGLRVYRQAKELNVLKQGFKVISTSQGLMTEKQAIKKKLGGEVICEIK